MPNISGKQAAAHFIEAAKDQNSPEWQYLLQTMENVEALQEEKGLGSELYQKLSTVRENAELFHKTQSAGKREYAFLYCAKAMQGLFDEAKSPFHADGFETLSNVAEEIQNRVEERDMGRGILRQMGEVKSASAWIEQFQKEAVEGQDPKPETVAKIIAARQLANAVRGKRANIDRTELSMDQIDAAAKQLLRTEAFDAYMKNNLPAAALVKDGHGGRLQEEYDSVAKSMDQAAAPASTWIERFQKEATKGEPVRAETVARIFAARQLANAVRGKRGNIDETLLSREEIDRRAERLKNNPVFKEFMEKNPPDARLVKDGHGGRLEMGFDAFIKAREDCQDLDAEMFGRYQHQYSCKTYDEFIVNECWSPHKADHASRDEMEQHAALIAAAAVMKKQNPPPAFNEQNLNARAVCLAASPSFRMALRVPEMARQTAMGNTLSVFETIGDLERKFQGLMDGARDTDTLTALRGKLGGHKAWTPAEKERMYHDPRIVAASEKVDAVNRKFSDISDLNEEDRLLCLITRTDEEVEQSPTSSKLVDLRAIRQRREQERVKWEKKWEQQYEQIRNNADLTDEQKQSEMNRVKEARSAQYRRGRELNERQNQYGIELKRATREMEKAQIAVFGVDPRQPQYQAEEKKYLEGRSPSYNKMFKAVSNYVTKVGSQDCTVKDGIDAVCSILEYQDGKEAKGGSLRERVDLSMKTLAQITAGTDAEYILDRQIQKINEARGLRPGQKGALSKDSLIERSAEDASLYDRIRNLGYAQPEDEMEVDEAEAVEEIKPEARKKAPAEPKKENRELIPEEEPEEGMYETNFL